VTSAVKLENEQQFMIAKKIQEMTGAKNIKLKPEVDPSLLCGFVVKYGKDGSGFIDMSVQGQINTIKNEIVVA
jgi:F-type H+-transporting ATPase subunit delta